MLATFADAESVRGIAAIVAFTLGSLLDVGCAIIDCNKTDTCEAQCCQRVCGGGESCSSISARHFHR